MKTVELIEDYGIKQIKTLEGIEAIRLRPGMYIGSVGPEGVRHITLEIISNVVDEYLNGHCTKCDIVVTNEGNISIQDDGRGVPFGKAEDGSETLVNIYTKLHTGAKFDSEGKTGYNTSGGMNGVGAKATNALSIKFKVESIRNNKKATAIFSQGELLQYIEEDREEKTHGTLVSFTPDETIFKEGTKLDYGLLKKQIQELAYLSPGLTFTLKFEDKDKEIITSKNGIQDYVEALSNNKNKITSIFYTETMEGRIGVKLAMCYNDSYSENYRLFTNSIPNSGGTHLTGFRTALTQTINKFARDQKILKDKDENLSGDDLKEGLILVLSLIMPDPVFSGQTKDILSSSEARTIVQRLVSKEIEIWLESHKKEGKAIIDKALNARKAREAAKKARETVREGGSKLKGLKAKMQLSNKFIDCVNKNPTERNLLLVEGLSAGSAAIEARNAKTDAIYMLRGKIISPLKTAIDKILANQEMSDIVKVIGGGFGKDFDVSKMQFDKIVITTDADSDGADIELLLITFFFTYMRPLVEAGKLYRAVTPLYIVRTGKEELYFYTDDELAQWKTTHKGGYEVLRAKGLGELNAKDLKKVCFENERFKRITISNAQACTNLLDILQGPSVEPRKKFIYDNATHLGFNFD
jgi:DNA gyrase subunit B